MANAADKDSSSLPDTVSGGESDLQARGVRCVAHNFPDNDDEDAASTIQSLLEPDVIVRHCQLSTPGLSHFIFTTAVCHLKIR